jgi:hypothetical protein
MPDIKEDVWTKDDEVKWYREELYHTFKDSKIGFEISRRGFSEINDPLLISLHDGFEKIAGDDILVIRFDGGNNAAKKMIESALEHFDQKQNTNIYLIKDYFNSYKQEKFMSKESIKKINDHFEKNSTVDPNGTLRVSGLSELNRELNKGKPFIGDILEFAVTHDRLPTDEEIAKMPQHGEQTAHGAVQPITSKEKIMSDQFENADDYSFLFNPSFFQKQLTMDNQEHTEQIQDTFLKSRNGAIVRCVSIMVDSGRKDLAKQILLTTNIDKRKFEEIKYKNT